MDAWNIHYLDNGVIVRQSMDGDDLVVEYSEKRMHIVSEYWKILGTQANNVYFIVDPDIPTQQYSLQRASFTKNSYAIEQLHEIETPTLMLNFPYYILNSEKGFVVRSLLSEDSFPCNCDHDEMLSLYARLKEVGQQLRNAMPPGMIADRMKDGRNHINSIIGSEMVNWMEMSNFFANGNSDRYARNYDRDDRALIVRVWQTLLEYQIIVPCRFAKHFADNNSLYKWNDLGDLQGDTRRHYAEETAEKLRVFYKWRNFTKEQERKPINDIPSAIALLARIRPDDVDSLQHVNSLLDNRKKFKTVVFRDYVVSVDNDEIKRQRGGEDIITVKNPGICAADLHIFDGFLYAIFVKKEESNSYRDPNVNYYQERSPKLMCINITTMATREMRIPRIGYDDQAHIKYISSIGIAHIVCRNNNHSRTFEVQLGPPKNTINGANQDRMNDVSEPQQRAVEVAKIERVNPVNGNDVEELRNTNGEQQNQIEEQKKRIEDLERKYKQLMLMVGRSGNVNES